MASMIATASAYFAGGEERRLVVVAMGTEYAEPATRLSGCHVVGGGCA
jgi:hypothetical protein